MREKKTADSKLIREVPAAAPDEMRPRWEYLTEVMARDEDLNAFGADGWELVEAIPQPGDRAVYYFKRRK